MDTQEENSNIVDVSPCEVCGVSTGVQSNGLVENTH